MTGAAELKQKQFGCAFCAISAGRVPAETAAISIKAGKEERKCRMNAYCR